jgi:hypothetical protein
LLFDCLKSTGEAADNGVVSCGQKIALYTSPSAHGLSTGAYANCYRGGQQTTDSPPAPDESGLQPDRQKNYPQAEKRAWDNHE